MVGEGPEGTGEVETRQQMTEETPLIPYLLVRPQDLLFGLRPPELTSLGRPEGDRRGPTPQSETYSYTLRLAILYTRCVVVFR